MKLIKTTSVLAATALLAACGGPEGDFEEAINASIGDDAKCWAISNMDGAEFPLKVAPGFLSDGPSEMLQALEANGTITLEEKSQRSSLMGQTYYEISLTEDGRSSGAWDPEEGFCIGRREVDEIVRFTFADQGANENAANVTYTWSMTDVPGWVDRDAFSAIDGMSGPVEASANVQKSSDGWHATGW